MFEGIQAVDQTLLDVSLWEIVAEILSMTINPSNPFEIDFEFIDKVPIEEGVLLTGSLLAFLENVWVQADPNTSFTDKGKHIQIALRIYRVSNPRFL